MVKFLYGSLENFNKITKDPLSIYFLSNGLIYRGNKLYLNVEAVLSDSNNDLLDEEGFILEQNLTTELIGKFYISLNSGRIKYVTDECAYIDISLLEIDNVIFSQANLEKIYEKIELPTLSVTDNTLIWTPGSIN